jgi:sugar phosphate isomerase/epimerase
MQLSQIAAQLYTVRTHCQTAAGLAESARKIRAIGYTAVQVSGVGPIPAAEITAIMRDAGLVICATHEPGATILDEPHRVAERLHTLGCRLTAYPYPHGIDFARAEVVENFARRLDTAGAVLRAEGITLAYHNHAFEFRRHGAGTVLDYLYRHTNPRHLAAELDTYWVQTGGGNILQWIERLSGRLPFMHCKDYGIDDRDQPVFREIGRGNLDFPAIIAAARRAGCQWYIVEQDECPGDPFESLRISYDYLVPLALPPAGGRPAAPA